MFRWFEGDPEPRQEEEAPLAGRPGPGGADGPLRVGRMPPGGVLGRTPYAVGDAQELFDLIKQQVDETIAIYRRERRTAAVRHLAHATLRENWRRLGLLYDGITFQREYNVEGRVFWIESPAERNPMRRRCCQLCRLPGHTRPTCPEQAGND